MPERADKAEEAHGAILAAQGALTRLWAALLALEVLDSSPPLPERREQAAAALKSAALDYHNAHARLNEALHTWAGHAGREAVEAAEGAAILAEAFGGGQVAALFTNPQAALRAMDRIDAETCRRARRLVGAPELGEGEAVSCLTDCPALHVCPHFAGGGAEGTAPEG